MVCLYSVLRIIAPVPLSIELPTPLILRLLSTENGANGESLLLENPIRNLLAQFPFFSYSLKIKEIIPSN